jgi:hypothetical protein
MPHEVSYNEQDRMVIVRVFGMATREDHFAARDGALRLCQQNACRSLLVDLRDVNTSLTSTPGCFAFGESVARAPGIFRLAHVMPTDPRSREDVRFTGVVESNRGIQVREFDSTEEARKWLLEGTRSEQQA